MTRNRNLPPSASHPGKKVTSDAPHSSDEKTKPLLGTDGTLEEKIGKYRITRVLGAGGMGIVYEAEQDFPQRKVALKILRSGSLEDQVSIRIFEREVQTLGRMKHQSIAAIYEAGRTNDGRQFLVMELVKGMSLMEFFQAQALTLHQRLELFGRICEAINYAHQRGVIHRDLKPSNIMIDSHGNPKVLDFGLAKITDADVTMATQVTETGLIQGTLSYMSPEQARAKPEDIDLRSDVYALGAILYELLTGQRPLELGGVVLPEAVRIICEDEPVRPGRLVPSLRGDLETIVLKSLEKSPERRYQNALAIKEDIDRLLTNQPILAHPPSTIYQAKKLVLRHKGAFGFTATVFLLVLGFGVWMSVLYSRAQRAERRAATKAETATQVSGFLVGMFEVADPTEALGDTITAREILEKGAERIELELKDQPEIQASLMGTIGQVYSSLGLYPDALRLLEKSLDTRRQFLAPSHPDVGSSLGTLAVVRHEHGDYATADSLYRESLAVLELGGPSLDEQRGQVLGGMAALQRDQGNYAAAESLGQAALRLNLRVLGPKDPKVARNLDLLGSANRHRGNYEAADSLYREALALNREHYGNEHPEVATVLNNLALLLQETGEYSEAERLLREALEMDRSFYGNEHPRVATNLNNLAILSKDMGKYDEAESYCRQALTLQKKRLGDEHPRVASALNNLAHVLDQKGDYPGAEKMYLEALALSRKLLGEKHQTVMICEVNLARVLKYQSRFDEAEAYFRGALEIAKAIFGTEHPHVATVMNNLASLLEDRGDLQAAEPVYRQVMDMRLKLFGAEHPAVATVQYYLAGLLRKKGAYEESEVLSRRSLELRRRLLGEKHPNFGMSLVGHGALFQARGQPDSAEVLLREAIPILKESLPSQHWHPPYAQSLLGECLLDLGRYEEAESLLVESHAALASLRGERDKEAQEARRRVVRLYEAWNKTARAAEFRGGP